MAAARFWRKVRAHQQTKHTPKSEKADLAAPADTVRKFSQTVIIFKTNEYSTVSVRFDRRLTTEKSFVDTPEKGGGAIPPHIVSAECKLNTKFLFMLCEIMMMIF